ncbi:MAG: tripartite tricarboxylate transporter substrate binding protein [Rhizobiales bacterium]|nr:tripartite tricarboxylate transporter substrate binding protein [Hyphomicrobiales bacterium]
MSINRRSVLELISAFAALGGIQGLAPSAFAQQYPDRPVRIIVPFPPGGSLDGAPRIVSQFVNAKHGWTIIIDNRAGAAGQTGTVAGKNSAADGYTLIAINGVTHGSASAIKRDPGYDPVKDFAPIVLLGDAPLVMLVRSDIPARTVPEFIALLKKNPGKFNYGSGGFGTQHHLAVAMLLDQGGLPANIATHVPAKGLALAITDLLAGNVQFMISSVGPAWQHVAAGKLRALAVTSAKRLKRLPDLPTMVELGFRDFEILAWSGLAAPAGTPDATLARWNEIANEALAEADVRKQLAGYDLDARGGTRAEFAEFISRERARYLALGNNTGLLAK